jgi:hypothetical protein
LILCDVMTSYSLSILQWATLTLADMQKTILDGVAAWSHGPLADDVSLVIAEVR